MKVDGFLIAIAAAVALAFAAPAWGASTGPLHMALVTDLGIALVFFLHGAALAPSAMGAAATNWRLHLIVQGTTWLVFPAIGLALWFGARDVLGDEMALGMLLLCAVSSTISSSVAMTALARGNVAGAIFNATLSGMLGMALTPLIVAYAGSGAGEGTPVLSQVFQIVLKLLAPFILGQLARPFLRVWIERWKPVVGKLDRAVIVLIVYVAFCDAVLAGMWTRKNALSVLEVAVLCSVLLFAVLTLTRLASRALNLSVEDEIAAVFGGSKKSLANGAPIAKVLFSGSPALGMILVPLLLYHQIQLIVCAVIARRYADRDKP